MTRLPLVAALAAAAFVLLPATAHGARIYVVDQTTL